VSPVVNRSFRRLVVLRSAINHHAFIIARTCKAPKERVWENDFGRVKFYLA
jgi:hypothetical protein